MYLAFCPGAAWHKYYHWYTYGPLTASTRTWALHAIGLTRIGSTRRLVYMHSPSMNAIYWWKHCNYLYKTCMNDWHVSNKVHLVVRDGGSNFVAGFRNAGIPAVSCFVHSLQLVVKEMILAQRGVESLLTCCRKILGHFRHSNIPCTPWLLFRLSFSYLNINQYKMSRHTGILLTTC